MGGRTGRGALLARRGSLTVAAPRSFSLRAFSILIGTAVVVFATDHLAKWLIVQHIVYRAQWPEATHFVNLTDQHNTGAAFSLLPQFQFVFLAAAVAVSAWILFAGQRYGHGAAVQITLGAVLGGATANAVDRAAQGYVVDFIDFHWWPVFNVADICIVLGIFVAVLTFGRRGAAPAGGAAH